MENMPSTKWPAEGEARQRRRDESLKRDLKSFPIFARLFGFIRPFFRPTLRETYWEYPAILGQFLFVLLVLVINGLLQWRGIDTTSFAPGPWFFALDILNFGFFRDPYLIVFILFIFFLNWMLNKLILVGIPRFSNAPVGKLLFISLISGILGLGFFGVVFSTLLFFQR